MRLPILVFALGTLWTSSIHTFFARGTKEREAIASDILSHAESSPTAMRDVNPEWDYMARTFTVLALANRAIAKPEEADRNLAAIDRIIDGTLTTERSRGDLHFLLPYAKRSPFRDPRARSLFIDGEMALMIGARDRIAPREATRAEGQIRASRILAAMERSPTLSGESYPNECWTFCNTTALAGLVLLGRAGDLPRRWVGLAKKTLRDDATGLLVSSYTYDGAPLDGPEGSSLWMTIANLSLFDEEFARDQYGRARRELRRSFAGFGWAREWPASKMGRADVDSGPIVPVLGASAGSSGLAFLGAAAAGDQDWLAELFTSIELIGFREEGHYQTSNAVGDAVIAYAISFGPLWKKVKS